MHFQIYKNNSNSLYCNKIILILTIGPLEKLVQSFLKHGKQGGLLVCHNSGYFLQNDLFTLKIGVVVAEQSIFKLEWYVCKIGIVRVLFGVGDFHPLWHEGRAGK